MDDDQIEKDALKEILSEAKINEEQTKSLTLAQVITNPCINKRLYFKNLVSTLREPLNPKIVRKRKVAGLDCDLSEDELMEKRKKWQSKKLVTGKEYDPDTEYIYDARKYYDPDKELESIEYRNKREAYLKLKQQQELKQNQPFALVDTHNPANEFIYSRKPYFRGHGYINRSRFQNHHTFRGQFMRHRGGRFLPQMEGFYTRGYLMNYPVMPYGDHEYPMLDEAWAGGNTVRMEFRQMTSEVYPGEEVEESNADTEVLIEDGSKKKPLKKRIKKKRKKKSSSLEISDNNNGLNEENNEKCKKANKSKNKIKLKELKKKLKRKKLQLKNYNLKDSQRKNEASANKHSLSHHDDGDDNELIVENNKYNHISNPDETFDNDFQINNFQNDVSEHVKGCSSYSSLSSRSITNSKWKRLSSHNKGDSSSSQNSYESDKNNSDKFEKRDEINYEEEMNKNSENNCDELKLINEGQKLEEVIKQTEELLYGLGNCVSFSKVKHYAKSYFLKTNSDEQLKVFLSRHIERSCSEVAYHSLSYLESVGAFESINKSKDDIDKHTFESYHAEKSSDFMRKYRINRVIKSKSDHVDFSSVHGEEKSLLNLTNDKNNESRNSSQSSYTVSEDEKISISSNDFETKIKKFGDNKNKKFKVKQNITSNLVESVSKLDSSSCEVKPTKPIYSSTKLDKTKSFCTLHSPKHQFKKKFRKSQSGTPKKYVDDHATGRKFENLQIRVTNSPFYESKNSIINDKNFDDYDCDFDSREMYVPGEYKNYYNPGKGYCENDKSDYIFDRNKSSEGNRGQYSGGHEDRHFYPAKNYRTKYCDINDYSYPPSKHFNQNYNSSHYKKDIEINKPYQTYTDKFIDNSSYTNKIWNRNYTAEDAHSLKFQPTSSKEHYTKIGSTEHIFKYVTDNTTNSTKASNNYSLTRCSFNADGQNYSNDHNHKKSVYERLGKKVNDFELESGKICARNKCDSRDNEIHSKRIPSPEITGYKRRAVDKNVKKQNLDDERHKYTALASKSHDLLIDKIKGKSPYSTYSGSSHDPKIKESLLKDKFKIDHKSSKNLHSAVSMIVKTEKYQKDKK